jgi:hypothetical protein
MFPVSTSIIHVTLQQYFFSEGDICFETTCYWHTISLYCTFLSAKTEANKQVYKRTVIAALFLWMAAVPCDPN